MASNKRKDSTGRVLRTGESQRKNGLYRFRYTTPDKNVHDVYAKTLAELREKESKIQRDLTDGINSVKADSLSVQDFFTEWIVLKNDVRQTTKDNYIRMWNSNIKCSSLANMKMCDVKQIHIRKFCKELEDSGKAKNTIKLLKGILQQMFQTATDSDIIRKNPVSGVKYSGTEKQRESLTQEEQNALLQFVRDSNVYNVYYPMIKIMIGTALRVGELTGLTWNDIDMQNGTISVNHQLRYVKIDGKTRFVITETKTESGNRVIPMTDVIKESFTEHKRIMLLTGKRSEATIDGKKNFVFTTKTGMPMATNSVNFFLKNIVDAYNKQESKFAENENREPVFLPHISAHILRHTGCTRMAESDVQPKTLQYIMGHSDIGITLNVYTHTNNEHVKKEMEKTSKIIGF